MKKLRRVHRGSEMHWVGDGFPVGSVFDYSGLGRELSPFLLPDYAAPSQVCCELKAETVAKSCFA